MLTLDDKALEKIEKRKTQLGRLNGLIQAEKELNEGNADVVDGMILVTNQYTGAQKRLNAATLDGLIATLQATLG